MRTYSTGEAASLLGTSERRLNDLIRRGKIEPVPPVRAGRRAWLEDDLQRAEQSLRQLLATGCGEDGAGDAS
jgi:DNA-binding transcriptional MerR regulator